MDLLIPPAAIPAEAENFNHIEAAERRYVPRLFCILHEKQTDNSV